MLTPEYLGEIVNHNALANDLRPDIVMCVIIQESGCNTFANRYEPFFYDHYLANKNRDQLSGWVPKIGELPNLPTEKRNRAMSWGLMQVMGDTARWCAKVNYPYLTTLCDPEKGVDVGCRVLSYYLGKAKGNYRTALAMYNSGVTPTITGWDYADEVISRLQAGEHLKYVKPH